MSISSHKKVGEGDWRPCTLPPWSTNSEICAALFCRERTGVGQKIETSLLQAAMNVQSQMFVKPLDE